MTVPIRRGRVGLLPDWWATLRDLPSTRIECDEIRAFCYATARDVPEEHQDEYGFGDAWSWECDASPD